MKFIASVEYAIHGMVYLAQFSDSKTVLITEVASAINVSEPYLRKVFQQLSRGGILSSQRGAKGGFRLARDSESISLKDIVETIEGSLPFYSCLKNVRNCDLSNPCPIHAVFERAQKKMADELGSISLRDILQEITASAPAADWLKVTV